MVRKGMIGIVMTALLLLGMISAGFAGDAAPYLRMGAGARSIAMGKAFVAVSDDATSSVWNPAGLPSIEDLSFTLYTSKLSFDRKHSFIGVVKNLKGKGAVGFAWINSGTEDIMGWDKTGKPTEKFDHSSNAIALSYGYAAERLNFGAGVKILTDKFSAKGYDDRAMGFGGVDVGVIYKAFDNTVTCGGALRNLLGKIGGDSVPSVLDLGIAVQFLQGNKATFAFDLSKEFSSIDESTLSVRLGVEYWLGRALALRAGGSHTGDRRSLFAGFGVRVAGLQFDYAYSPEDDTVNRIGGSTHFMSLSYTY